MSSELIGALLNEESELYPDVVLLAPPVELENSSVLPSSFLLTCSTVRSHLKTMQVQRRTSRQDQALSFFSARLNNGFSC